MAVRGEGVGIRGGLCRARSPAISSAGPSTWGVTLFDTAEVYGLGRSERILGEALGERRGSVFLATKLFPVLPLAPVVEQRAVASASRLGTQPLDLYQVHWPNPVVSDRTIMRGMSALQRVGLVGEVGVSNYPLAR